MEDLKISNEANLMIKAGDGLKKVKVLCMVTGGEEKDTYSIDMHAHWDECCWWHERLKLLDSSKENAFNLVNNHSGVLHDLVEALLEIQFNIT